MGPLLAVVPNRDMLAFATAGDPEGRAALDTIRLAGFAEGDHPISDKFFRFENGAWSVVD